MALSEPLAVPSGNGEPPAAGPPGQRVRPAWRRRFLLALGALPHQQAPVSGNSVVGLSLRPGQDIYVGIPVRLSGTFLSFTHWVAITLDTPFIFREPFYPGGEPARYLTCPHT